MENATALNPTPERKSIGERVTESGWVLRERFDNRFDTHVEPPVAGQCNIYIVDFNDGFGYVPEEIAAQRPEYTDVLVRLRQRVVEFSDHLKKSAAVNISN